MGTRPSNGWHEETYDEIEALRRRIAEGESYIADAIAAGRPVDRSSTYLTQLRARLAALEQRFMAEITAPPPSHPSPPVPPVPGDGPQRRWSTRHCPACGAAHYGPWLAKTEIWCGACHLRHRQAIAPSPRHL